MCRPYQNPLCCNKCIYLTVKKASGNTKKRTCLKFSPRKKCCCLNNEKKGVTTLYPPKLCKSRISPYSTHFTTIFQVCFGALGMRTMKNRILPAKFVCHHHFQFVFRTKNGWWRMGSAIKSGKIIDPMRVCSGGGINKQYTDEYTVYRLENSWSVGALETIYGNMSLSKVPTPPKKRMGTNTYKNMIVGFPSR